MLTLGIDEAGRGAVVGPLVMYGVITGEPVADYLRECGVNDSKKLTPEKRAKLSEKIKQHCYYCYQVRDAKTIDKYVAKKRLNVLEREMAENIIANLAGVHEGLADQIVLDGTGIFEQISFQVQRLQEIPRICEAKADQKYLAVAAASICAKVHRDTVVREIMGEGFKGGSGYPNPATQRWIEKIAASQVDPKFIGELRYIRQSWNWAGLNKLKERLQCL